MPNKRPHNAKNISDEQYIQAFQNIKNGSTQNIEAERLGIIPRSLRKAKQRLTRKGLWDHGNGNDPVPEPYFVKGKSQYYDKDGKPAGVWVKSDLDKERWLEIIETAAKEFYQDLPPIQVAEVPSGYLDKDIIPWFQIGDAHCGMLAHKDEVGASFDLDIFESELCEAMSILIDECTPRERCVIQDLGDFTHYETFDGITMASGHKLDFDTRYPKMIRVAIRTFRFIVERALSKFKYVDVIINQGNHSRSNDIWMRELIDVAYGHTGRVTAINNESVFIPYRMGNTFVMCHHQDKTKGQRLCEVMVTDFRQDYGEASFHYIDVGHIHTRVMAREYGDIIVESWNQLAASDKYAHDFGWRSRSCLNRVDRSRTYGEVGRRKLPVEEVWDRLDKCTKGDNVGVRRKVYTV